jgi:hypothetical protein
MQSRWAVIAVVYLLIGGCAPSVESVCYSRISSSELQASRNSFTKNLLALSDRVSREYSENPGILDFPISTNGQIYLVSTCRYLSRVKSYAPADIVFMESTEAEYQQQYELAGKSGVFVPLER